MTVTQHREMVGIAIDSALVEGVLAVPEMPIGMVLFAHGSGSGRNSPRNKQVAAALRQAGLGTLVMDLLTVREDSDTSTRFDIGLLASRLALAAEWLAAHPSTRGLPLGLFGASTGAAAALQLAAEQPDRVKAVVSRGGRPDLTGEQQLAVVRAPTLLIVGGLDSEVLARNQRALAVMECHKSMDIVPGATHLFEEPGALDQVALLAARWFVRWLGRDSQL